MTDQHTLIAFFTAGTCLFLLFASFIIYSFLIYKRSQYKHKLEKQKLAFERENDALRIKLEEQEYAFSSISQELHDNIKSKLGTGQLNVYRIGDLTNDAKQKVLIERLESIFVEVIQEVDAISRSLNSQFLHNIPLDQALQERLDSIQATSAIRCALTVSGTQYELPADSKLHVYRIVQEALQNCVKHSHAKNVSLQVDYSRHVFMISISDDGRGFNMTDRQGIGGLGFINMSQRARHINGLLELTSEPNNGCKINLTLNLPLDAQEKN